MVRPLETVADNGAGNDCRQRLIAARGRRTHRGASLQVAGLQSDLDFGGEDLI